MSNNLNMVFDKYPPQGNTVDNTTMYFIKPKPDPNAITIEIIVPDDNYSVTLKHSYATKTGITYINWGNYKTSTSSISQDVTGILNTLTVSHTYVLKGTYTISITSTSLIYLNSEITVVGTQSQINIMSAFTVGQNAPIQINTTSNLYLFGQNANMLTNITLYKNWSETQYGGFYEATLYSTSLKTLYIEVPIRFTAAANGTYIPFPNMPNFEKLILNYPVVTGSSNNISLTNNTKLKVYVPDDLVHSYKNSAVWVPNISKIYPLSSLNVL